MGDRIPSMDAPSSGGNIATELAKERNRAAADRTLNSWIRTSLALIGFGFGISKIHASLEAMGLHGPSDPMRSTLLVGGSFILLGLLALLAAVIQHLRNLEAAGAAGFCLYRHAADQHGGRHHPASDRCVQLHRNLPVSDVSRLDESAFGLG